MSKEQWFQCQLCGSLHKEKIHFDIEDDLFVELKCRHCKNYTQHIWVGEHPEDAYVYGNANIDPRYYIYNTKQND